MMGQEICLAFGGNAGMLPKAFEISYKDHITNEEVR